MRIIYFFNQSNGQHYETNETENLDTGNYDYTVKGRSGGYHGLSYDGDMAQSKEALIEKLATFFQPWGTRLNWEILYPCS